MTTSKSLVFRFADIEVREREFCIVKAGEVLAVEPKTFQVLLCMLRKPQKLVSKEELLNAVWGDTSVTENSLPRNIAKLRRLLEDDAREPRYIATVATVGYRFVCEVEVSEDVQGILDSVDTRGSAAGVESVEASANGRVSNVATSPASTNKVTVDTKTPPQTPNQRRWRDRKFVLAGIAAALLLLLAGVILRRQFTGDSTVPAYGVQHLVMEQRLTSNPSDAPIKNAVVSPDGKYVAYADSTGLYLRQISSGETRPWSLPRGFIARPLSWFPDGTHLLVVRIAGQPKDRRLWKPSLYKLSILGGDPQEMMSGAWAGCVSPDGSRIAYMPTPTLSEMWIMDSDGANPRKVVSSGEVTKNDAYQSWISSVAWSPTGQHLAYIENHFVGAPFPAQPRHLLRIIGATGEDAMLVLDDPRIGEALWWGRDGRIVFSYREDPVSRQDNYGVYSIRVDERTLKGASPPQPITQAEGRIGGISGTADGRQLVVLRSNEMPQVFISSRDSASHQWKEPRRLTLDANVNIADTWTADSKAVLFVSNRNGTWKLFKQNIDETTPEVLAEGRSIATPRLTPDGSQVLYLSTSNPDDVSFPASLISRPLEGGTPRTIIEGKGILNYQCAKAPSTLCIFSQVDGQDTVFRSFDLEHGVGRELMRIPTGGENWSLSSDGSKLVIFLDQHRIRFVSLGTGAADDVTVKDWPLTNGDWAASGKTVLMPSYAANGLPVILEVDQTGKAKVILRGSSDIDFVFMIQSPDERYGLVVKVVQSDSNAWIVKNF
jgi:DNA-binding winged helix-turn-helix (wHTH) protein/Tol biopolymer transport system component